MKKLIAILVAFFSLIGLASCQGTSGGSVSNNLKNNGYTVDTYTPEQYETQQKGALKCTKYTGMSQVIVGYNKDDNTVLIFVFDSSGNASKMVEDTDALDVLTRFADRYADEGQTSKLGSHNNLVWVGSAKARNAAGINI